MFEKLLDVLTMLIQAINDNTDAIKGRHPAQGTHQENVTATEKPVADDDVPQISKGSAPPPPNKGKGKKTPPPPSKGGSTASAASSEPAVTYTAEQINEELLNLYNANGEDRTPIDEVFADFGVRGLNGLDESKFGEFMDAVKAKITVLQA